MTGTEVAASHNNYLMTRNKMLPGPVAHTPVILATHKAEMRRISVHKTLSQKYPTQKRPGRVAQLVEHLPSKHEALTK
jgi:hypothetical protein